MSRKTNCVIVLLAAMAAAECGDDVYEDDED